jgi:hypothetical protein
MGARQNIFFLWRQETPKNYRKNKINKRQIQKIRDEIVNKNIEI